MLLSVEGYLILPSLYSSSSILSLFVGNQWWTVLIQNSGEHNLSMDVLAPNPVDYVLVEIEKQQTKMVRIIFLFHHVVSMVYLELA